MARMEQLEELKDLVYEQAKAAIQDGNLQGADEWSGLAIKLEEHLWQISERKQRSPTMKTVSANPQELFQKWWESIDEIVFLYLGLVLSIMSEGIARIFQPLGTIFLSLFLSLLVVAVVIGYALWKRKNFYRD